jgi:hypothetical protein
MKSESFRPSAKNGTKRFSLWLVKYQLLEGVVILISPTDAPVQTRIEIENLHARCHFDKIERLRQKSSNLSPKFRINYGSKSIGYAVVGLQGCSGMYYALKSREIWKKWIYPT